MEGGVSNIPSIFCHTRTQQERVNTAPVNQWVTPLQTLRLLASSWLGALGIHSYEKYSWKEETPGARCGGACLEPQHMVDTGIGSLRPACITRHTVSINKQISVVYKSLSQRHLLWQPNGPRLVPVWEGLVNTSHKRRSQSQDNPGREADHRWPSPVWFHVCGSRTRKCTQATDLRFVCTGVGVGVTTKRYGFLFRVMKMS